MIAPVQVPHSCVDWSLKYGGILKLTDLWLRHQESLRNERLPISSFWMPTGLTHKSDRQYLTLPLYLQPPFKENYTVYVEQSIFASFLNIFIRLLWSMYEPVSSLSLVGSLWRSPFELQLIFNIGCSFPFSRLTQLKYRRPL